MNQVTEMMLREQSAAVVKSHKEVDVSYLFLTCKRIIDFFLSLSLLLITSPIIALLIIWIKYESPGPALYVQERVGYRGKMIRVFKLRSMYIDAEKDGPRWAVRNDSRITKVGGFIRRTRLDELPQLINVLRNDMSLIGPRPERYAFMLQFSEKIPGFMNRVLVKPGLTGWAQVNGGYDLTPEEKFEYDMYYIHHYSAWLETKIFFKTIFIVLTGKGAR